MRFWWEFCWEANGMRFWMGIFMYFRLKAIGKWLWIFHVFLSRSNWEMIVMRILMYFHLGGDWNEVFRLGAIGEYQNLIDKDYYPYVQYISILNLTFINDRYLVLCIILIFFLQYYFSFNFVISKLVLFL